ncbi:DUF4064 domain-containing protein [Brevibacterium sp. XM4083]|uniref:DUF4064 domain-containing protein n=1 Tax=Brevibacterium sp. XM4083 TaxID=2583238 RepID=UPI001128FDF6|nr:DUF4064 domain-containing protein [Brevibacterium sp. XM4083]MCM1012768.1 hypothetical protein [Brevibacterium sp. XM4083]
MSEQWPGPKPPENPGQPYVRNAGVPGHVPEHQPGSGPGGRWSESRQHSAAASAAVDPGWFARIALWVSILIDRLPAITLLPFIYSTSIADGLPDLAALYSAVVLIAGIIACLVGVLAFLLVRNTSWLRRMVGGGIYLVAGILSVAVPPVMTRLLTEFVYRMNAEYSLFPIVFAVFSTIVVAALLIAWNIVRNRSWWVHLVAAGLAAVSAVVVAVVQYVTTLQAADPAVAGLISQVLSLLLFFAALGLLHVCGRLRGGSVPVVAQPALGERRRLQPGPAAGGQYSGTQYPGAQCWGDQFSGGQHPGAPNYGGQHSGAPYPGAQHHGAQYQGAQYPYAPGEDAQYSGAPSPDAQHPYARNPFAQHPGTGQSSGQATGAHEAHGSPQASGPNSADQPYGYGRHDSTQRSDSTQGFGGQWTAGQPYDGQPYGGQPYDGRHGAGDPPRRPRH